MQKDVSNARSDGLTWRENFFSLDKTKMHVVNICCFLPVQYPLPLFWECPSDFLGICPLPLGTIFMELSDYGSKCKGASWHFLPNPTLTCQDPSDRSSRNLAQGQNMVGAEFFFFFFFNLPKEIVSISSPRSPPLLCICLSGGLVMLLFPRYWKLLHILPLNPTFL